MRGEECVTITIEMNSQVKGYGLSGHAKTAVGLEGKVFFSLLETLLWKPGFYVLSSSYSDAAHMFREVAPPAV